MNERAYNVIGARYCDDDITQKDLDKIQNLVDDTLEELHKKLEILGYEQVMGVLCKKGKYDK